MESLEKIREGIERRLEQLGEETNRLQAALDALSGDSGAAVRIRRTRSATRSSSRSSTLDAAHAAGQDRRRTLAQRRSATAPTANGRTVDERDAAPATPAQRALSQLRRELAAGLRTR